MDRELLVELIARAEVDVADDELLITQQQHSIRKLRQDGRATGAAEDRLHALEFAHTRHAALRDCLTQKLADSEFKWADVAPRWSAPLHHGADPLASPAVNRFS